VHNVTIERNPLWNNVKTEKGPFDLIGDIHGCFDELHALLVKLGYHVQKDDKYTVTHPEGRKVIFVGDLVDRGPKTPEVLRIVMDMVESGAAFCVNGNHDDKLKRKLQGRDVKVARGLAESLSQLEYEPQEIKDKAGNESDLSFLDEFNILVEKKYLIQIDKDIEIMQLGLKLLETNLNAIRSRIELEKSERDRNFQNIVTIVGSGTAIAAYLDFKGEKCQAIFKSSKKAETTKSTINSQNQAQDYPDFCNNFWIGSFLVPISFLIILGSIGFALKKIMQKIN
jgi:hypothetical protein